MARDALPIGHSVELRAETEYLQCRQEQLTPVGQVILGIVEQPVGRARAFFASSRAEIDVWIARLINWNWFSYLNIVSALKLVIH